MEFKTLFEQRVEKRELWTEIRDVAQSIDSHLSEYRKAKLKGMEERHAAVMRLLKHEKTVQLPHDMNVFLRARKRILAGRFVKAIDPNTGKPKNRSEPEADCCIIEAILTFFEKPKKSKSDDPQLLLCTSNLSDFGGAEVEKNKFGLHPVMKEGLPPTELLTKLSFLTKFISEQKEIHEPPAAQVIEAVEREANELRRTSALTGYVVASTARTSYGGGAIPLYPRAVLQLRGIAALYHDTAVKFLNSLLVSGHVDEAARSGLHVLSEQFAANMIRFRVEFRSPIGKNMFDVEKDRKLDEIDDAMRALQAFVNVVDDLPAPSDSLRGAERQSYSNTFLRMIEELGLLLKELDGIITAPES